MVETRSKKRADGSSQPYLMLDAAQRSALKRYRYVGGDSSLIYKYLLSPLAQNCVDYLCPSWLAPNVITLGGLLFSALAVVVSLIFNPTNEPDAGPRWLHLFCAGCMFVYQTLDNMDGKQARKIGASSPLGLLFDHGCDSINTGILLMPLAGVVGAGWSMSMICVISTTFAAFYIQTWEEYHVGELVLPILNGPTEGQLSLMAMAVTSYFCGSGYWQTPTIKVADDSLLNLVGFSWMCPSCMTTSHNHRVCTSELHTPWEMAMFGLMFAGVLTSVGTIGKVILKKCGDASSAGDALRDIVESLVGLAPLAWMLVSSWSWCSWSSVALSPSCRVFTILYLSSIFTEITTHVMISHISGTQIRVMSRLSVLVLPLILLANLFYYNVPYVLERGLFAPASLFSLEQAKLRDSLQPVISEQTIIPVVTLLSIAFTAYQVGHTYSEVAMSLGISIFTVKKKSV